MSLSMNDSLTEAQAKLRLYKAVESAGSQAAFAKRHGISQQHVCDVLRCRRPLTDRLLAAVGLRRMVVYLPLKRRRK